MLPNGNNIPFRVKMTDTLKQSLICIKMDVDGFHMLPTPRSVTPMSSRDDIK